MAEEPDTRQHVMLTDKIRHWIRGVLLTSNLPHEIREELVRYTSNRRHMEQKRARTIPFNLLKSIYDYHREKNEQAVVSGLYLHELCEDTELYFPEYQPPPRNPELESRIQRLKEEQMQREYDAMTRNVASRTIRRPADESFGYQLKALNNQLLNVFNFVVTVGGSFAFMFKATEYMMERPDFVMQMCSGLTAATIVFFADLYFLIKYSA